MKKELIRTIVLLVSTAITFFEYLVLLWYWAGAGLFNLFATPIILCMYLITAISLKKRIHIDSAWDVAVKSLIFLIVPLLSMLTVELIAFLTGMDTVIM